MNHLLLMTHTPGTGPQEGTLRVRRRDGALA
jgi:hypothetical protein